MVSSLNVRNLLESGSVLARVYAGSAIIFLFYLAQMEVDIYDD